MEINLPVLSYHNAKETYDTLQLWTQIVGKIKIAKLPWMNHAWHTTLIVTPAGLTTNCIPNGNQYFEIDFDFIQHQLIIKTSRGFSHQFGLKGISVADFYEKVFKSLRELEIEVEINPIPNEIDDVILLYMDNVHSTYDPEEAKAFHKSLLFAQDVFTEFRSDFIGKCSPVHFFWGGFDLAVSRFTGRKAPKHPGGIPHLPDWIAQEAYSHEVSSCGFWPGSKILPFAAFYSYIYPEPDGFKRTDIAPEEAFYHEELREFILSYEVVRQSENPKETLLAFLQSTYDAASGLGHWNKNDLERDFKELKIHSHS